MPAQPWKSSINDTYQAIELLLYGFGVIPGREFDPRRAEDRRMRPLILPNLKEARKILGVRLEPPNKDGFRNWRLPRDWKQRLAEAGIEIES
jgi:hypothetical protein